MTVFADFASAASPYVDLYGISFVVPELQLARYWANKQRLVFLRDIIDRAAILEHCFESLNEAAVALRCVDDRRASLEPDERGWRRIPLEMTKEEDHWVRRVDALTALIHYEFPSIVSMPRQLRVNVDTYSEVNYLVKVRDRFLSHSRRDGVQRGRPGGGSLARRDVIALNQWSTDDLLALGRSELVIGSEEWKGFAMRTSNGCGRKSKTKSSPRPK